MSALLSRTPCLLRLVSGGAVLLWLVVPARAGERYEDFLAGLRRRGYHDMAAHYLKTIKDRPDLPADLRETWDFELATSLKSAAESAADASQKQSLVDEARRHEERFLAEHPDHPILVARRIDEATDMLQRGVRLATIAEHARDEQRRGRWARLARARLEQARNLLAAILSPAETPQASPTPVAPELAEAAVKQVLLEYWLGKLPRGDDAGSSTGRSGQLKDMIDRLSEISSTARGQFAGLVALYWQAKLLQEAGDKETALDVCDEVLDFAPDESDPPKSAAEAAFFAEAYALRWSLLRQRGQPEQIASEAEHWLEANSALRDSASFAAVQLELARARLAEAEKLLGPQRRAAQQASAKILSDALTVSGPHQLEALKLLESSEADKPAAARSDPFAIALRRAELLARELRWDEAETEYEQLLSKARIDGASAGAQVDRFSRALCGLWLAESQLASVEGDFEVSLTRARQAIERFPGFEQTRDLGALALGGAAKALETNPESAAAREPLDALSTYLSEKWSSSAQAEDAILQLTRLDFSGDQFEQGFARLSLLKPESPRYLLAMEFGARRAWKRRESELRKPEEERDAEEAKQLAEYARQFANAALSRKELDFQRAARLRVMLAKLSLEAQDNRQAMEVLGPVVDRLNQKGGLPQDEGLVVAGLTVQALCASNDLPRAARIVADVANASTDEAARNDRLAAMLAELFSLPRDKRPTEFAATAKPVYAALTNRKQLTPRSLLWLGLVGHELGERATSRKHLEAALEAVAGNPQAAGQLRAQTRQARWLLAQSFQESEEFERAINQLDQLLRESPNSPRLLVAKARALQALSERDPGRLGDAIEEWTRVRLATTPRPEFRKEYFESVYFAAEGLARRAGTPNEKTGLQQAAQLLEGALITAPNLDGQESVERYQKLLARIREALAATGTPGEPQPN